MYIWLYSNSKQRWAKWRLSTFDLYPGGEGHCVQRQICDILRPQLAMNRFLPLWPHRFPHFGYTHLGGGGGGSDIRSMSSIRPICKCRCPPPFVRHSKGSNQREVMGTEYWSSMPYVIWVTARQWFEGSPSKLPPQHSTHHASPLELCAWQDADQGQHSSLRLTVVMLPVM